MQKIKAVNRAILTALFTISLVGASARAQGFTFDDSSSFTTAQDPFSPFLTLPPPNVRFDFGGPNTTFAPIVWSSQDAGGSATSGSVKLTMGLNATLDGGSTSAGFTMDLLNNAGIFSFLSFDVMVDPASATEAAGAASGYGYFQVATRDSGYGFNGIGAIGEDIGAAYTGTVAGQWRHFNVALGGANTSIRALTFQDYGGPGQNVNGTVILYLDNVVLGVPEPSTATLLLLCGGLLPLIRRWRRS